ncbi:hypothetical protein Clacol_000496 [Clathrus columnatus]|uniref:Mitochondrial carrier n=1 Tax=Clathrus columnatus TaxID=1419009 RepID=A0AAV4ZZY2_9AGAM|nr:hypothetical protein Clacol_000496 [Clathrus columnatus]
MASNIKIAKRPAQFGVLVRFRANYSPKGLQLDEDGGAQPHAGPVVRSYFAMFGRVVKLEGWTGLFKGIMPSILSTSVVTVFLWFYIGSTMPSSPGRYSSPATSPLQVLVYSIVIATIGLPVTILINRSITTPYLLPWSNSRYSLRRLFTPTELAKPWILYTTPGLLGAKLLHLVYVVLVLRTFRTLLLPSINKLANGTYDGETRIPSDFTVLRFVTYIIIAALSTVILCPLEVIATRLSLQRNHPTTIPYQAASQEETVEPDEMYAGTEDVIGLRNEYDPYTGFTDAAKRMVEEEGWRALYRGWWVTLLAGILSTFA